MMENRFLESLRKKERECRNLQLQAEGYRKANDLKSCVMVLQSAATIEFELTQLTIGEEKKHHEREKTKLDNEIMKIRNEIDKSSNVLNNQNQNNRVSTVSDTNSFTKMVRSWIKEEGPKHSFEDVSGMTDIKNKLQECIKDSKAEVLMNYLQIPQLNSYFFVGPPGCGKTYIIEAFAHELMGQKYKYIPVQAAEIISRYVGDAEKIVTCLFEEVINNAPCVVFIDEIDSVCKNRSLPNLPEYAANITTAFLTGYNRMHSTDAKVIFLGATNYPNRVEEAMFDRVEIIRVDLPDAEARACAFERYFKDILTLEDDLKFQYMADKTDDYSYRDIERVVNAIKNFVFKESLERYNNENAAVEAIRSGNYKLRKSIFDDVITQITPSPSEDSIKAIEEWEKKKNK